MSLDDYIGREGNLLEETAEQIHQLRIPHPILTNEDIQNDSLHLAWRPQVDHLPDALPRGWRGGESLRDALDDLWSAGPAAR